MTYAKDYRRRAIFLLHVYGISVQDIFGPKEQTIRCWSLFSFSKVSWRSERKKDNLEVCSTVRDRSPAVLLGGAARFAERQVSRTTKCVAEYDMQGSEFRH
jgi:hypothetical protein